MLPTRQALGKKEINDQCEVSVRRRERWVWCGLWVVDPAGRKPHLFVSWWWKDRWTGDSAYDMAVRDGCPMWITKPLGENVVTQKEVCWIKRYGCGAAVAGSREWSDGLIWFKMRGRGSLAGVRSRVWRSRRSLPDKGEWGVLVVICRWWPGGARFAWLVFRWLWSCMLSVGTWQGWCFTDKQSEVHSSLWFFLLSVILTTTKNSWKLTFSCKI